MRGELFNANIFIKFDIGSIPKSSNKNLLQINQLFILNTNGDRNRGIRLGIHLVLCSTFRQ